MRSLASLVGVALLAVAGAAGANAKFPEAGQIVVDPVDPSRIVLRTTFGIVISEDAGASWQGICEAAVGYKDYEPAVAVSDRFVMAGLAEHVAISEGGCDWAPATGTSDRYMSDMATSTLDPAQAIGITIEALSSQTRLWRTEDGGKSWSEHGAPLPAGFLGRTLDYGDATTIYLSGVMGDPAEGVLLRSVDDGASWTVHPIPGSDLAEEPYIGALGDASTVYIRLAGAPGRLLVTRDGGDSWEGIFTGQGFLRGLTVSPDQQTVLVGGEKDGIWRAQVPAAGDDWTFERISDFLPLCLRWTDAGVYACGHVFFNDGTGVALSKDGGQTFESLVCFADITRRDCPTETSGAACVSDWFDVADQLSRAACASDATPKPPDPPGPEPPPEAPPPEASSGCQCSLTPTAPPAPLALLALALLPLRRRYRRKPVPAASRT